MVLLLVVCAVAINLNSCTTVRAYGPYYEEADCKHYGALAVDRGQAAKYYCVQVRG